MHLLLAAAFAQDPEEPTSEEVVEEATEVARALAEQISALGAELEAAQDTADATAEELEALRTLHAAAATLADPAQAREARLEAAGALAHLEGGAVFLEGATQSRDTRLAQGAVSALAAGGHVDALRRTTRGLATHAVQESAIQGLVGLGTREAGEALYAIASDEGTSRSLRGLAREGLEDHYPEVLADQGELEDSSATFVGVTGMSAGSGLAGGILLSSVGVWGRSDEAVAIGAVGGTLIGGGTGGLYGVTQDATDAHGLRYASNVAWGLTSSELLTQVVLDPWPIQRSAAEHRKRQNKAAFLRAFGTTAGAGLGLYTVRNGEADTRDVFGSNLAGIAGMQLGFGVADMAVEQGEQFCYPFEGGAGCDDYKRWYRTRYAAGLAGTAAGLGAAGALRHGWHPGFDDHLFSGIVAAESTWAVMHLYDAGNEQPWSYDALGRATAATTFVAAEGAAHAFDLGYRHDAGAAYGTLAGNFLGAGIPMAVSGEMPTEAIQRTMAPVGFAGMVAGTALAPRVRFDPGDVTLVTAGTPILTAQSAAYAGYFDARGQLKGQQVEGITLSAAALSSAGLIGASQVASPKALDVGVMGTGAVWGAWYGVLTPIALELDGPEETLLLTGSATSQAFMVGTAAGIYGLDLDSRRLLLPQLVAVSGATFGSLGVALINPDGSDIAKGAVIGSVVGFAAGATIESRREVPAARSAMLFKPNLRLPGRLSFAAAPTSIEGDLAVYAQLDWRETR